MEFPEINKFIDYDDFEHWHLCRWRIDDLYLPSETFYTLPQFVIPKVARMYRCDLYLWEGKIKTYNEIRKLNAPKPVYTSKLTSVVILEVWEDQGCDGHTAYSLSGFAFVCEKDIAESLKKQVYPEDYLRNIR